MARCRVAQVDGELELHCKLPAHVVQSAGVLRQAMALQGSSVIDHDVASVLSLLACRLAGEASPRECMVLQVGPLVNTCTTIQLTALKLVVMPCIAHCAWEAPPLACC